MRIQFTHIDQYKLQVLYTEVSRYHFDVNSPTTIRITSVLPGEIVSTVDDQMKTLDISIKADKNQKKNGINGKSLVLSQGL
jgi:hypothetical protein